MSNLGTERARKPLGRGLSALLPSKPAPVAASLETAPGAEATPTPASGVRTVSVDAITPNPVQPRTIFRPERLEELAASIRANGILQPLVVRESGTGTFQIVAGERRLRAAKLAGLNEVPIIVQEVADPKMLELALIENLQREDLNPIETAHAYDRLSRELGLSQEEIGRRTGKDRSSVTNMMRLLRLPKEVQQLLAENRLTMGQARALLGLESPEEQIRLAEKAAAQGLNVRQVEAMVQEAHSPGEGSSRKSGPRSDKLDPNVEAALEELRRILQTKVKIVELSEERGRIEIQYYSQEHLESIYELIVGGRR